MTMVRQYPPPLPPPLHSPLGPFQQLLPSPNGQLLRNASGFDPQGMARQLPQQYAHPLTRHNSYHSQGSDSGSNTVKPPEHMLRRKTPNGILAAAYDGTSVEETEKPHATKHIILPATAESSMLYNYKQELPLRSPGVQHDGSVDWSPSLYFQSGSGRALPQIDSMLNQMPPLQKHPQYQMFGNPFGGGPEQMMQSPLGPTVSNDQGPFGPYWHDGTFIPYRPAAMRDPRYYHHHAPNWSHPQHRAYMNHAYNNALPNMHIQPHPYQIQQLQTPFPLLGRSANDYPASFQHPYPNAALDYQDQPLPVPPSHRPHPDYLLGSGQSTPVGDHFPTPNPNEFGPQSLNMQSREKIFAWAHTVYVDLLKYLQSTRKTSSQHPNGHQQPVRPHIYPKPPKQPAANFSNAPSSTANTHANASRTSTFDIHSQQHVNRDVFRRPSHSRSSSAWSVDSNMNRQQWYPSQTQPFSNPHSVHPQIAGMEPLRPLRRMSGSVANNHQSRNEVPPSMTAASALDALTKHCEESKWNWIDGILLGGCLAYALGDYQKAHGWYKHILKLDKE